MPADPTIPELVARLRELHNARRYPTETLATTIRDDQSAQVYATSIGPMRAVRPVAETTVDYADLIAETLNALPAILDALDRLTELYDVTQARLEAFEEQEPDARTCAEWVATVALKSSDVYSAARRYLCGEQLRRVERERDEAAKEVLP